MRSLKELAEQAYHINREKGYTGNTEQEVNIPLKLLLIHSEVSEATEAYRGGIGVGDRLFTSEMSTFQSLPDDEFVKHYKTIIKGTLSEELADIIIRTSSLAEELSIDIQKHVELKLRFNSLDDKVKKF